MRGRIRGLEFLGLFCASIAIWRTPLATDMKLALSSNAHTHILLILPLSVALIYFQARGALACERERWLGLILLTGLTRFHKVGRLASVAQRALFFKRLSLSTICARDVLDRQRNPLPGAPNFPIVSVSSVLSISNHTFPGTRLELDHGVPATADRCGRGPSRANDPPSPGGIAAV